MLWGRRLRMPLGLAIASFTLATASLAVPPQGSSKSASATLDSREAVGTGSTLTRLSKKLAALPLGEASLVVFAPLKTQAKQKLNPKALGAFQRSLVDVVGSGAPLAQKRLTQALGLNEARTEARRRNLALLYVEPSLRNGTLSLDVTFTQWPSSFWQRVLLPQGTVTHHSLLKESADEVLRRLLPPPKGLLTTLLKFPNPVHSPVALACGDLDQDGGAELLIVGRHEIAVGRFEGRKFLKEASVLWSTLSAVAAAPLRSPIAAAQLTPEGVIVGLSDRENLVHLNARLEKLEEAPSAYPVSARSCVTFGPTGLGNTESSCLSTKSPPSTPHSSEFDAVARGQVTEESGVVSRVRSQLTHGGVTQSTIESGLRAGQTIETSGLGAALVWADLEGDGTLELLASGPGISAKSDEISLLRLEEKGLKRLKRLKSGEVHALAACPFTGENPLPVIAAVGRELWLLR